MKLAIIKTWDTTLDSYCSRTPLINYFKTKNFVIYSWCRDEDGVEQTFSDFLEIYCYVKNQGDYKLKIINDYNYNNRDFCNIIYNFEKFIKKCKKYYSKKIAYYKSPNAHLYRQRYGNFKNVL